MGALPCIGLWVPVQGPGVTEQVAYCCKRKTCAYILWSRDEPSPNRSWADPPPHIDDRE